jgi:hypothetical protein
MTDTPTYRIETLADMLTIPEDRREVFLTDLAIWLEIYKPLSDLAAEISNGTVLKAATYMTWKDDGISGVSAICIGVGDKTVATIDKDGLRFSEETSDSPTPAAPEPEPPASPPASPPTS